ncbi:protein of unknown function [Pararobbsia alpina]
MSIRIEKKIRTFITNLITLSTQGFLIATETRT